MAAPMLEPDKLQKAIDAVTHDAGPGMEYKFLGYKSESRSTKSGKLFDLFYLQFKLSEEGYEPTQCVATYFLTPDWFEQVDWCDDYGTFGFDVLRSARTIAHHLLETY